MNVTRSRTIPRVPGSWSAAASALYGRAQPGGWLSGSRRAAQAVARSRQRRDNS